MRVFYLILLSFFISCRSKYTVVDLNISSSSELNFIYAKKVSDESIYEIISVKKDTFYEHAKKISKGDTLYLKLVKLNKFKERSYKTGENLFMNDTIVNDTYVKRGYYSANIDDLYYKG